MVYEHFRAATANSDGFNYNFVSAADFNDWRRQTHSFQDMAAWKWHGVNLTGAHGDLPENVLSSAGSWNLFSVLDVPMALGRAFTPQEDQPGGDQVVILTWSLYQRRFNGNPSVLGKQVLLNAVPHTIIGVLPPDIAMLEGMEFWVPLAERPDSQNGSVSGSCRDVAGNTTIRVFSLSYDATGPSVTATPGRAPDSNGWYNHALLVTFTGTDPTSGVDSCVPPQGYSGPDDGHASVNGSCTDRAGNTTGQAYGLSYDATANQYVYVWKTERAWAGTCRVLRLKLADGTVHDAYFTFTK